MTAFPPLNPTGEFPYFAYEGSTPEPLFNRISLDPLFNRQSSVIQAAYQSYYDFPRDRIRAKLLGLRSRKRSGFSKNARGEPTFVVPHFFDQPYWGRRVFELGCGPPPVRLRKLTPGILAGALEELSTDSSYQVAARDLGDRLHLEDGTGLAADIVEETIESYPGNYYATNDLMGAAS
jgi:hypothetical protein